jgi:Transposase DDE domain group 1
MLVKVSTESRFKPVEIGHIGDVRAVVEAVPELMSAHAGMGLIGKIDRQVGLTKELARRINDIRRERRVKHSAEDIVLQRAVQIAAGFTDGNDCDRLRMDAAVKWALNRDPVFGQEGVSQESLSKFEKHAINKNNRRNVLDLFIDHFIRQQKKRLKKIVVEFDGTMIETHGKQQGSVYRGKYKCQMYFPLLGFIGDWLVAAVLRSGNKAESRTIHTALRVIVEKLRAKWPGVKVMVRLDAAFGSPALYKWCRENWVDYEIGLRPTSVLNLHARAFAQEAEKRFLEKFGQPRYTGSQGKKKAHAEHTRISNLPTDKRMAAEEEQKLRRTRVVGEFSYKAEKWGNWERIIVRCDFTDKGLDVRYVLVSGRFGIPQMIYEGSYCRRGLTEQFIGQLKRTGQKLSAQSYRSNQFRLIMYGVAYQLLVHLRESAGKKFERSDVDTLRKTFMIVPMIVRRTAKKVVFQIGEYDPRTPDFLATWRRLSTA